MKTTRLSSMKMIKLAGEEGFEPSLRGPEPRVLPLDDSPATDVRCHVHDITESKSSPLPAFLNDILPSIVALATPQKAAGILKLIQSQLYNPPNIPIISRPPADINTPIFYSSALALLKSCYQTLTKKLVFARMTRAWIPAPNEGREVILC